TLFRSRSLLRLELVRFDERFGPRRSELRLREARVFFDAVRHREPHVGGLVHVPLPAVHLAREPAPAHVVAPAQVRGRDPRQLLVVHADTLIGRSRCASHYYWSLALRLPLLLVARASPPS